MTEATLTAPRVAPPVADRVFDVGIDERVPLPRLALLGIQNVFGMTGMFVFPGLLGRSFNMPPDQIAYLYGMVFICCGLITILQSALLLRLPIAQGPYAGSFAALMAIGHAPGGGLGAAYGSFFVASIIWSLLSIPVRGLSVVALVARHLRAPLISGMMVLLIMIQIANVAFPNWIGPRASPGFPLVNLGAGAVAVAVIMGLVAWGGPRARIGAILIGLAVGTAVFAVFRPVSFDAVLAAPLLVTPKLFPFGFEARPELVIIFLVALMSAAIGSMALYQTVAEWGGQDLTPVRVSEGVFGVALGSIIAAALGGIGTIVYPDNMGMLRATRVGSRYTTLAAGVLLIVLGCCVKFDLLMVVVPLPVISAAATLLFGMVFMHGVAILARVTWDDRHLIAAGLAFLVGLGGLFVPPDVQETFPLFTRLLLQQPVMSGGVVLLVLYFVLCRPARPTA